MRIDNANKDIIEYKLREDQVPMEQSKHHRNNLAFDQLINEKVIKLIL